LSESLGCVRHLPLEGNMKKFPHLLVGLLRLPLPE